MPSTSPSLDAVRASAPCRRPRCAAVVVSVAAAILSACSTPGDADGPAACEPRPGDGGAAAGFELLACGASRHIVDDRTGAELILDATPRRIVSQAVGSDEMLLELLPAERAADLVAVSALSHEPRYTALWEEARRVRRTVTDRTEEILALAPDLVLAASYTTPETRSQLRNAGVPTLVLHRFTGVDAVAANIRTVGFALRLDAEAERLVAELEARIARAAAGLAPVLASRAGPVAAVMWGSGSVYAEGTTHDDLLRRLGLRNPATDAGLEGWPRVDQEQLLVWAPDVVLLSARRGAEERATDAFRRRFDELFAAGGPAPAVAVLPDDLASTVSQELGELAEVMAARIAEALRTRPPAAADGAAP